MIAAPASKSFTAAPAGPQKNRISPLVWMNLVCLDAPLVAVSWHWLFARSFGAAIPRGATAALFLTAWVIYLADRFGDAISLGQAPRLSLRQEFCLRHRRTWIAALAFIALADLLVVAIALDPVAMALGGVVGLFAFVYLLLNRIAAAVWRVLPLKEVSIGSIFAAGTLVGLVRGLTMAAFPLWLLFAALCALNCICIAVWERELDVTQARISIATEFPRVSQCVYPALLLLAFAAAAAGTMLSAALCASAALLAFVHWRRNSIQPDVRTALADLVLLTPLVVLAIV
jgi:hypothetical protein